MTLDVVVRLPGLHLDVAIAWDIHYGIPSLESSSSIGLEVRRTRKAKRTITDEPGHYGNMTYTHQVIGVKQQL